MSAAAKARRTNNDLEIVVYERSPYISYGACGFPYFIKGEIPRMSALMERTTEDFAEQGISEPAPSRESRLALPGETPAKRWTSPTDPLR